MAKSLVIVESPPKARTITRYLGRGFQVKASLGHVKDLPKKTLGVDVAKGFGPTYDIIPGKMKVIDELRNAAEKAEDIYLATDPDREGEAICAHLWEILKNKKKRKFHRVMFNEITKEAIQEAFRHPAKINGHLVHAQQTRRILDRLVGYQVSPLLWGKGQAGDFRRARADGCAALDCGEGTRDSGLQIAGILDHEGSPGGASSPCLRGPARRSSKARRSRFPMKLRPPSTAGRSKRPTSKSGR